MLSKPVMSVEACLGVLVTEGLRFHKVKGIAIGLGATQLVGVSAVQATHEWTLVAVNTLLAPRRSDSRRSSDPRQDRPRLMRVEAFLRVGKTRRLVESGGVEGVAVNLSATHVIGVAPEATLVWHLAMGIVDPGDLVAGGRHRRDQSGGAGE